MKIEIIIIRKGGREEIPTEPFYYCLIVIEPYREGTTAKS